MKKQNYLVTFREGWNTVYATNQAEAEKMAKAQFSQYDILRVELISEKDLRLMYYLTE